MARKAAAVIRVGAPGYRTARDLYRRVADQGWQAIGIDPARAPKRVTLGNVTAAVLQQHVRDRLKA